MLTCNQCKCIPFINYFEVKYLTNDIYNKFDEKCVILGFD